jgi:hypothetical protein
MTTLAKVTNQTYINVTADGGPRGLTLARGDVGWYEEPICPSEGPRSPVVEVVCHLLAANQDQIGPPPYMSRLEPEK